MIGLLYLIIGIFLGYSVLSRTKLLTWVYEDISEEAVTTTVLKPPRWFLYFPSAFLLGTIISIVLTYTVAVLFTNSGQPLLYANAICMPLMSATAALLRYRSVKGNHKTPNLPSCHKSDWPFLLVVLASVIVSCLLMIYPFHQEGQLLHIGFSVVGDFGPHLAMIRSFSQGMNFPTQYPLFPDGHVNHHFLFHFLAGNLEFLGLRLDWAFNLPSILSFVSFWMLLFFYSLQISSRYAVGILVLVFSIMRSSYGLPDRLSAQSPSSFSGVLSYILSNDVWLGVAERDNLGLLNPTPNLYANQRHMVFAMAVLILVLILFYPVLNNTNSKLEKEPFRGRMRLLFTDHQAWKARDVGRAVFAGLLLGMTGFINGAVVIAGLLILSIHALFSQHKLEYLLTAVLSVFLVSVQTVFFMGSGANAFSPRFFFGFVSERKDFWGVISFYHVVLGLLPLLVLMAFLILGKKYRILAVAFSIPLIFGTCIQMSPDIHMNHKYVAITALFLSICAAGFIVMLLDTRKQVFVGMAIITILLMTVTGISDATAFYHQNKEDYKWHFAINLNEDLTSWFTHFSEPDAVVLSDTFHWIHPILLSGRKVFNANAAYYAWSAGYDIYHRDQLTRLIFSSNDATELKKLLLDAGITHIVVTDSTRASDQYSLNEGLLNELFESILLKDSMNTCIYVVR